jgi:hypothetical protein
VDSKQAGLAEQSDAASKRRRLDSEIDAELLELAKRARERRNLIREKIKALSQLPNDADQLPNAADQLSNPPSTLNYHSRLSVLRCRHDSTLSPTLKITGSTREERCL